MKNDASLFEMALNGEKAAGLPEGVDLNDFYAYMPQHNYIYIPTRELWPASSVNSRIEPIPVLGPDGKPVVDGNGKEKTTPAATWLDRNRPVEQMTWAPGEPELILGRHIAEGGWIERKGVACFNLYRPPTIIRGDASKITPWLDHVYTVYGQDTDHIIRWLAHRVQHPEVKINHALVLGGSQGRQGHTAGARQARGRTVEFQRSLAAAGARAVQRVPEIRDPAHQRGPRSRRHRSFQVLRPHEGLHRIAARRAARGREVPERA